MHLCLGVRPDELYCEHCSRVMYKCEIFSIKKKSHRALYLSSPVALFSLKHAKFSVACEQAPKLGHRAKRTESEARGMEQVKYGPHLSSSIPSSTFLFALFPIWDPVHGPRP